MYDPIKSGHGCTKVYTTVYFHNFWIIVHTGNAVIQLLQLFLQQQQSLCELHVDTIKKYF